jgi:Protein of unknown function (DUF3224)
VVRHLGRFADGEANATLTIVSGTGELTGATGIGIFIADPSGLITLDIDV